MPILLTMHADRAVLQLARAGFYFEPTPEFPDNVVCYLCLKRVGGWEEIGRAHV